MRVVYIQNIGEILIEEVPTPTPGPQEALVRVKACGICQTDFKAYTGERTGLNYPLVVGHEFSGEIAEIGKDVRNFKEGDQVIVCPTVHCGQCKWCKQGLSHYCDKGATLGGDGMPDIRNGAFAEFVVVPESSLYRKPSNTSFPAAALTEPLAGSYKGLVEYSQLRTGEDLVIVGAGAMGLLLTQVASSSGAGNIVLIDLQDYKLEYAKKCGATFTINAQKLDPKEEVHKVLPEGPDIVFEAAGAIEAARLAFDLCRRGTRLNIFGVTTPGDISISPGKIHFQETRMDASFGVTARAMLAAINLMEKKLVDTNKIITHEFPLTKAAEAMEKMKEVERIKIIIKP